MTVVMQECLQLIMVLQMQHEGTHDSQQVTSCANQLHPIPSRKQQIDQYLHVCSQCSSCWGHWLIISPHSIIADISTLIFPTSPFLCSLLCPLLALSAAFSPSRSAGVLHHIFLFCALVCSYLSQGICFSPIRPLPPPPSEARGADKTGEPRKR